MRELMGHAFYGDELHSIGKGTWHSREAMRRSDAAFAALTDADWQVIDEIVRAFFSRPRVGAFGGTITAGDGFFIVAYMAAMRPKYMLEVGVASGFSSSLILAAAERLGLLAEHGARGTAFLFSLDLMSVHANGRETGSFLRDNFAQYEPFWKLRVDVTTATLQPGDLPDFDGPVMAFLDGGHNHPWPAVDLLYLHRLVPACRWALMQDTQMMERWVADAVIYDVPVPHPVRGAQIAFNHWPGAKLVGHGMCYNMAAARLDIDPRQADQFVAAMRAYPYEIQGEQVAVCDRFLAEAAARPGAAPPVRHLSLASR